MAFLAIWVRVASSEMGKNILFIHVLYDSRMKILCVYDLKAKGQHYLCLMLMCLPVDIVKKMF